MLAVSRGRASVARRNGRNPLSSKSAEKGEFPFAKQTERGENHKRGFPLKGCDLIIFYKIQDIYEHENF